MFELSLLLLLFSLIIYSFVSVEHYLIRNGKDIINLTILYLSLIGIILCLTILQNLSFAILVPTFVIIGIINTTRVL